MTTLPTLALSALIFLSPLVAQAQSNPIVGKWSIEFAAGMRIENDAPTVLMAKGTLTIETSGDSLVATLHVEPNAEIQARPDSRFTTRMTTGTVIFEQHSQARMNSNGEETLVPAVTIWTLDVTGDTIAGTLARRIEGMELPVVGPQPVKGTRIKG